MVNVAFRVFILSVFLQCDGGRGFEFEFDPLDKHIKGQLLNHVSRVDDVLKEEYVPVYVAPQDGLKVGDKVESLPGQPSNAPLFDQYSGYVTVDPKAGRALFYYFVESPQNSYTKPLVLWLNGGPGCSSLGGGAMMELGPFRVNSDGQTLHSNHFAWNNANIIFLESPAGVGFSYSNTTSDYELSGDKRTAEDSYTFLVNWLERFPEYKSRDFFIAGESYAGHYVPQLAQLILQNNKNTNQTVINLEGIAIGNANIDYEARLKGVYDFLWSHALISDEIKEGISLNCNFSLEENSKECKEYLSQVGDAVGNLFMYDIYAPLCTSSPQSATFDPCSSKYIYNYLNTPQVQKALHANLTLLPNPWEPCNFNVGGIYSSSSLTVLPVIQELMTSGMSVWIYSGDTDAKVPVTSTRYSINKIRTPVKTKWYPWYTEEEVAGYAVEYENLTFVTVRGAGHLVPSYQPARALTMFSSFLQGKLPPMQDLKDDHTLSRKS